MSACKHGGKHPMTESSEHLAVDNSIDNGNPKRAKQNDFASTSPNGLTDSQGNLAASSFEKENSVPLSSGSPAPSRSKKPTVASAEEAAEEYRKWFERRLKDVKDMCKEMRDFLHREDCTLEECRQVFEKYDFPRSTWDHESDSKDGILAIFKELSFERDITKALLVHQGRKRTMKQAKDLISKRLKTDPRDCSKCFLLSLKAGFIDIDFDYPEEAVIWQDECKECSEKVTARAKDIVRQPDEGDSDFQKGAVFCSKCGLGYYVSGLCQGVPRLSFGKNHLHCTRCPRNGKCFRDCREKHCTDCGKHYFCAAGSSCYWCEDKRREAILRERELYGDYSGDDDDDGEEHW
eukprot:gb/GECG01004747.1/.p1 GENE.gb/GECG01004747.1/~~gb/GECG01004747.1/.p1  ORF type:complete len:349 (+),score=45.60 gb/GECG01004747.1/:1-1047(+)